MIKLPRQPKEILILLAMIAGLSFVLAGLQSSIVNVSAQLHPIMFVAPERMHFGMSFPQEVRTGEFVVVAKYSYPEKINYYIAQRPKPIWPEPEGCGQGFDPYFDVGIWEAREYCQNNPQDFDCCYPSICRYLKKISEEDEGDISILASLNPVGGEDLVDYWLAELHVPTIKGYVGQDYEDIPIDEPGLYGCDMYIAFLEGSYCGDGIKQSPNDIGVGGPEDDGYEDCDIEDGVPEGYYCTQNCVLEPEEPEPYCGDGNLDLGEDCDDGENNGVPCVPPYGSSCNYCSIECEEITFPGPKCGDGNIDRPDEQCEHDVDCPIGMSCIYCKCVIEEEPGCTPEDTRPCDTGEPGICAAGTQTCDGEGFWGECVRDSDPVTEICNNALDDDCDGDIDCDDSDCASDPECISEPEPECTSGDTRPCDTGQLGICMVGVQTCDTEGSWGECVGVNEPATEICDNYLDDDCDGDIDCDDSDCSGSSGCGEIVIYGGGGGTIYLAISNEANRDSRTDTATVNWFTNLPATSRVIYDTVSHSTLGSPPNYGYAYSTDEDPTKVTFHTVTITGLIPETTYYWRAVSHTSPDEVLGDEMTFATEVPLPEIPPTEGPSEEILPEVPPEETPPTEVPPEIPGEEITLGEPTEAEKMAIGEEETGKPEEKQPETNFGKFLAAIGSFFGLEEPCWIFFLGTLILIILFLLSKKKKGRGLPLLILIAIILYCIFCRSTCWILIFSAVVLFILSLIFRRKKKEEHHEDHHVEHPGF